MYTCRSEAKILVNIAPSLYKREINSMMGRVATKFVNRNRLQAKTHFFKAFPDSIKKFKNPASTVPIEQSHQQIVYYLQDYFPFFNFPGPSRILKNLFASLLQSSMSMKIFF